MTVTKLTMGEYNALVAAVDQYDQYLVDNEAGNASMTKEREKLDSAMTKVRALTKYRRPRG